MKEFKPTRAYIRGNRITGKIKATLIGGVHNGMKRYSSDTSLVEPVDIKNYDEITHATYFTNPSTLYQSNGNKLKDGSEEFIYIKTAPLYKILFEDFNWDGTFKNK